MRILLDATVIHLGGGIQVALDVLARAIASNDEVFAVVSTEVCRELAPELRAKCLMFAVIDLKPYKLDYPVKVRRLRQLEAKIAPDVVYTIFGPAYWRPATAHVVGFALPAMIYPEVVRTLPGSMYMKMRRYVGDYVRSRSLARAHLILVETDAVKERLNSIFDIPPNRIFVARNCCSALFLQEINRCLMEQIRPDPGVFTILVPSSDYPHKNLGIIPEVLRCLVRDCGIRCRFVLTVSAASALWSAIRKECHGADLSSAIETLGAVPHQQIAEAYFRAHAVFLPTLMECSTAVYPEAMAARVPIVTSDRDFAKTQCGHAALYFNPADARNAAEKLALVCANDHVRDQCIRAGADKLKENYPSSEGRWNTIRQCLQHAIALGGR